MTYTFLCMESTRSTLTCLSQTHITSLLLKKFNMVTCKLCLTPLSSDSHLSSLDGEPLPDATIYFSMVVGLRYLTLS